MAILRSIPRFRKGPSFRGRIMIDSFRGVLRVRKWPKKRGRPRSAKQRWWVDWFVQANSLAKYADGMSRARAIEMSKGSGLYPRDVLLMAMRGTLYTWVDSTGWKWYSMAAIGDISESLDVLAQTVGSVLVRAADRWRAPVAGALGDLLTCKGPGNAPEWSPPAGVGGISQETLVGTPIVPDNTKSQYDIDVSAYAQVEITLDNIGFAASQHPRIRYSIDGGSTFKAGASDYRRMFLKAASSGNANVAFHFLSSGNSAANHFARATLTNIGAGRAVLAALLSYPSTLAQIDGGFANFDGPVTHIRIYSSAGGNFNAGTIRLVGIR